MNESRLRWFRQEGYQEHNTDDGAARKVKKGKTKEVVYECDECGHAVRLARFRRCREQMIATDDLLW